MNQWIEWVESDTLFSGKPTYTKESLPLFDSVSKLFPIWGTTGKLCHPEARWLAETETDAWQRWCHKKSFKTGVSYNPILHLSHWITSYIQLPRAPWTLHAVAPRALWDDDLGWSPMTSSCILCIFWGTFDPFWTGRPPDFMVKHTSKPWFPATIFLSRSNDWLNPTDKSTQDPGPEQRHDARGGGTRGAQPCRQARTGTYHENAVIKITFY